MKFGKELVRSQIPKWSRFYVDYKRLKRVLNGIVASAATPEDGMAVFFFHCDAELAKAANFFDGKLADYARRVSALATLAQRADVRGDTGRTLGFIADSRELLASLQNLKRFAIMNATACAKIAKKFDKKTSRRDVGLPLLEVEYVRTKVSLYNIASTSSVQTLIETVAELIEEMEAKVGDDDDDDGGDNDSALASRAAASALSVTRSLSGMSSSTSTAKERRQSTSSIRGYVHGRSPGRQHHAHPASASSSSISLSPPLPMRSSEHSHHATHKHRHRRTGSFTVTSSLLETIGRDDAAAFGEAVQAGDLNKGELASVLVHACSCNATACARLCLDQLGCSPDATTAVHRRPAAAVAANQGHVAILKLLSEHGADLNARDADESSVVHSAARSGSLACLRVLVDASGVNLAARNADGDSAVPCAVASGNADVLALLLRHAPPLVIDLSRALCSACMSGSAREVDLILSSVALLCADTAFCQEVQTAVPGFSLASLVDGGGATATEVPLHIASEYGHAECVQLLVDRGANVARVTPERHQTALFSAVMNNHIECVRVLLESQASVRVVDAQSWSPYTHAVWRGLRPIVSLLAATDPMCCTDGIAVEMSNLVQYTKHKPMASAVLEHAETDARDAWRRIYGHRFLVDREKLVLSVVGVELYGRDAMSMALDGLRLVIFGRHCQVDNVNSASEFSMNLPLAPAAVESCSFIAKSIDTVVLHLTVESPTGRLAAVLPARILKSGIDTYTAVLVDQRTHEPAGEVRLRSVRITPFAHPAMDIGMRTYWRTMKHMQLIGHRGAGAHNNAAVDSGFHRSHVQENTILSFVTAASLGAAYIEFDVQWTSDGTPVIYHDFIVHDTGFSVPVERLSLAEFLHLHKRSTSNSSSTAASSGSKSSRGRARPSSTTASSSSSTRHRSSSTSDIPLDMCSSSSTTAAQQPSASLAKVSTVVTDQFATLKDAFAKVPVSVGFNIEVKYPTESEALEDNLPLGGSKLNERIDAVLKVVYEHSGTRNVIFSSFNPDVCLSLSAKQPNYPVFFLTTAGIADNMHSDVRIMSLKGAVSFATQWDLLGVVSRADPFLECPQLIREMKQSGLLLLTYGNMNNTVGNVDLQSRLGVDAVIVDHVAHVRHGLDRGSSQQSSDTKK